MDELMNDENPAGPSGSTVCGLAIEPIAAVW